MISEIKMGDLVGLESTPRWGMRVKVVVGLKQDIVEVADHNGKSKVPVKRLNMTIPGFVDIPLSQALAREYGLIK